jgi:uncharacterized protein (DUF1499 family)
MTRNSLLILSILQGVACSAGVKGGEMRGTVPPTLAPCPTSPNCVSSRARDAAQRVKPLPFDGDPVEAIHRLRKVIDDMPRTRIVSAGDDWLRAEFSSRLFGFVDDVEAVVDSTRRVIDIRSASRTGHWDLGTNRSRVEAIREAFVQNAPKDA